MRGHDVAETKREISRVLIVGMGQFGISLAKSLTSQGIDVLAVETDTARVELAKQFIDEVKCRVPIWKKEHYADGETEWLKGAG